MHLFCSAQPIASDPFSLDYCSKNKTYHMKQNLVMSSRFKLNCFNHIIKLGSQNYSHVAHIEVIRQQNG